MGTTTPRLVLYKPALGDAGSTYDTEFPANMDTLDNAVLITTLTTKGDLLARDTSDVVRIGTGTSGQVLTAGGAGTIPTWQTPGAATHPGIASHIRWTID